MKAEMDAALKHGAPRGSMELARLSLAAEAHRQTCEAMATQLRVMLNAARDGEEVTADMLATGFATLARWESQQ